MEEFVNLIRYGKVEEMGDNKHVKVFGRLCNYPNKSVISTTMANADARKIQFIMDRETILANCVGKSTEEILKELGWAKSQIDNKKGKTEWIFQLLVFPEESLDEVYLSTWSNMRMLLIKNYPSLKSVVDRHWDEMTNKSFGDLEMMHDRPFSSENFTFSGLDHKIKNNGIDSITITDLRHFCYSDLGLKQLFTGDGFSYDYHGNKTNPEYVTSNKLREDIRDLKIIQLNTI
jgi:hypothetical protein